MSHYQRMQEPPTSGYYSGGSSDEDEETGYERNLRKQKEKQGNQNMDFIKKHELMNSSAGTREFLKDIRESLVF